MKAIPLILGIFLSLNALGDDAKKTLPAATPTPAPVGTVERPLVPDEEEGEKTTQREVPEGWIPNYRYPKKNERHLFSLNVGGNLLNPQASVNFLVAKKLTVGLMGYYFKYTFQGLESAHTGGMIGVSAYSQDDLKGLWVFFGLGGATTQSSFLDGRATGNQPSWVLAITVGQRWRWGHFNTGISAGGMYFDQLHVSSFKYHVGVFYPAVIYDIGFSW